MLIENFIIEVYCCIEVELKILRTEVSWRSRGFAPKLTDSEVLTMGIVGEFLGIDSEKKIWDYFRHHFSDWFPNLGSRTTFTRQLANLWHISQKVWERIVFKLNAKADGLYMVDGFPMPVCGFRRVPIAKCFKDTASFGYCKAKSMMYFGFHGNVIVNDMGVIVGMSLTKANASEREAVWELSDNLSGILCGDKGYMSFLLQEDLLAEKNITLLTPLMKRCRKQQNKSLTKLILNFRKRVETVIGQLSEQFHIEKIRARDIWHLTARISRKVLSHTLAMFINKKFGNKPLQLSKLLVL